MGSPSARSPAAAGTATKTERRSAKPSVSASAARSPRAAWAAMLGSAAVASAMPNTPSGNSITRSA